MKLINKTIYVTRDLKKFFTRIAKDELTPGQSRQVTFRIVYAKLDNHSGCATIGGYRGTIRVPKPPREINPMSLATLIAHEMAHLRGLGHSEMRGNPRYNWRGGKPMAPTLYAWSNELTIGMRKSAVKSKPSKETVISKQLTHAQSMLTRSTSKLRRAEALVRRWNKKVRYYERRAQYLDAHLDK